MIVNMSGSSRLAFFKELYQEAESVMSENYEALDKWFEQYKGTNEIDGSQVTADIVRNITYELIETQVTGYLPTPAVEPRRYSEKHLRNAKSIERLLCMTRNRLPFEEMNDIDERYTYIYGGSVWLIEWDESITTHNTVGDVKISCISPKNFVGQPNIYRVDDMEYCFVKFETTKEDILRRYGASEQQLDEVESEDGIYDKTATLYVCYYKNEEDKICQFIWSGDAVLLDIEDYYSRKRYVCKKCGKRKEVCMCEDNSDSDYEMLNADSEELQKDIPLSDGSVIPAKSTVFKDGHAVMESQQKQVFSENGEMAFENVGGVMLPKFSEVSVPKLEKTRLPFYTPSAFPIVIRKNTSQEDTILGQSDCEFIRPQQQAINKVESRIIQKLLRSGVTPVIPEDSNVTVNNSIFGNVIKMRPGQSANQFGTVDTTPNISQDIAEAERLYDHAKRILGISNSFQGQYDSSAQSGRAKQLQINQAAGRLDSKRKMKNFAYSNIDKVIFQYYLAYADEPRYATYTDEYGMIQDVEFNRYDFLERGEGGEYFYYDEYIFSADSSADYERNREYLWEQNLSNLKQGTYGDPSLSITLLRYWRIMEKYHYPGARDNVEYFKAEVKKQNQIAELQNVLKTTQDELEMHKLYEAELKRRGVTR